MIANFDQTALMRQIIIKAFIKQELDGTRIITDKDMESVGCDPKDIRAKINTKVETTLSPFTPEGYEAGPYLTLAKLHHRVMNRYHIDFDNWRLRLPSVPDTNFTRWIVADTRYYWLACLNSRWYRSATAEEIVQLKKMMKKGLEK